MAKVELNFISAISGSIGGTVYSHNRGGKYIRNRSIPVDPSTLYQSKIRSYAGIAASAWRSLTMAEIRAWNQYASAITRPTGLGSFRTPSGYELFLESYCNKLIVSSGSVGAPPPPVFTFPSMNASLAYSYFAGASSLTWTITADQITSFKASYTPIFSTNLAYKTVAKSLRMLRDPGTGDLYVPYDGQDVVNIYDTYFGTSLASNPLAPGSGIYWRITGLDANYFNTPMLHGLITP